MEMEEELTKIDAAIEAILSGGQSYTLNTGGGSRQVTYADYNALVKRRNELQTRIAASNGDLGTRLTIGW
jgi:hypothetical protein